jgi:peptidoglycan-associated lipoprotein
MNLMKCTKFVALSAVALLAACVVVGCKRKPQNVTPLPGRGETGAPTSESPSGAKLPSQGPQLPPPDFGAKPEPVKAIPDSGMPPVGPDRFANMDEDRERFKNETVYFDFDKSNLKSTETHKLDTVAAAMKTMPANALLVEGHCDERGTEEYNRALGERRALGIREYLVMKGMDAANIDTISFGENKPADPGHNEAVWAKNRRGELILLVPKAK